MYVTYTGVVIPKWFIKNSKKRTNTNQRVRQSLSNSYHWFFVDNFQIFIPVNYKMSVYRLLI